MNSHVQTRRLEIARAASMLSAGEALAHEVATRQAHIARNTRRARFFAAQARQEALHARIFAAVSDMLAPRVRAAPPGAEALARFRSRIERDLDAGNLWASVIGLQVALEALGGAVLAELEEVIAKHWPVLSPVHRMLARQEAAHHAFGVRWIEAALECGELDPINVHSAAGDYHPLAADVLAACTEVIEGFDVPPEQYAARFEDALPSWFRNASR
jgi:hypothetical protein